MRYYFAPLEGVTGYIYRRAHRRYFPGVDKYFAPFIPTNQNHRFSNREMRDILPENNEGIPLVPQLLGKVAEDFVCAARVLGALGYGEVNLNLGCPSGTVVAKGKGSGALANPEQLDSFLEEIFSRSDVGISVKTRLGIREPEEFECLLEIFNRYPIIELTVHPRVQRDFYKNAVRVDAFAAALKVSRNPVCYNGDLKTGEDCAALSARFPAVESLMLGRGLAADPALVTKLRGGPSADRETLRAFHDELYEGYRRDFGNDRNAIMRMKELWSYMAERFKGSEKHARRIRKLTDAGEYESAVNSIFRELEPADEAL